MQGDNQAERFVLQVTHGYATSSTGPGKPGYEVGVLDSCNCYRVVDSYTSARRYAMEKAQDRANRLNNLERLRQC